MAAGSRNSAFALHADMEAAASTHHGVLPVSRDGDHRVVAPPPRQQSFSSAGEGGGGGGCVEKTFFWEKLWKYIFLLHTLAALCLIGYLAIGSALAGRKKNPTAHLKFHPARLYLPLFSATLASLAFAASWLAFTLRLPGEALKASFWLGPLLGLALGVLLFNTGDAVGLGLGVCVIVAAFAMSLYCCWAAPRRDDAAEVLAVALSATAQGGIAKFVALALAVGLVASAAWVVAGGVASARPTRFTALHVLLLLVSYVWTMQVVRTGTHVAVARVAYPHFAHGAGGDGCLASEAFRRVCTSLLGRVCLGAAVVPAVVLFRGTARGMRVLAGGADEFLFSCVGCCGGAADGLAGRANRWGLAYLGADEKGMTRASGEAWGALERGGMVEVVDADLTSSFCFLSGVAGGGVSALVAGVWTACVDGVAYTVPSSLCAFVVGYLMVVVSMAWPQACVCCYYMAYAERPESARYGSAIEKRIRDMQRSASFAT